MRWAERPWRSTRRPCHTHTDRAIASSPAATGHGSGKRLEPSDMIEMMAAPVLVLWVIDNTQKYTGGAGSIGMRLAFHALYGIDDAFARVEFSGRTDCAIFRDAAREHGIDEETLDSEQARFLDAYVPYLEK